MSGKGISDLPMPPNRFRPDKCVVAGKRGQAFPSRADKEAEDLCRARLLRLWAGKYFGKDGTQEAENLADDLADAIETGIIYRSPASAVWMRDVQIRLAGGLWQLAEQNGYHDRAFTIMPQCWDVPAAQLACFDVEAWQTALRGMVRSYGGAEADGYLYAGLHGEFAQTTNSLRLHVHGVACGEMIEVVDALRTSPKLKGYKNEAGTLAKAKRKTPVRINRKPIDNRPAPYTYTLQSFWPSRVYEDPDSGHELRGRRSRIPDPHHTAHLIWLDRWRVENLSLLMGLRVTDEGFQMTRPISTNF